MSTSLVFSYEFHPAGQGIFASGFLAQRSPQIENIFRWIFDCGSVSPRRVLQPAIVSYRAKMAGNHVELLTISHFDYDHVSGLQSLLSGMQVGTIVLPYLTALERLVLGSHHEDASPFYHAFLSNPVAWILETAESVERIIVVGNGDGENPFLPDRSPNRPINRSGDQRPSERAWLLKPRIPSAENPPLSEEDNGRENNEGKREAVSSETKDFAHQLGTQLAFAPSSFPAEAMCCSKAMWEFLFFHKPQPQSVRANLERRLNKLLVPRNSKPIQRELFRLLRRGAIEAESDLLTALSSKKTRKLVRKVYADVLGGDGKLNAASLCLYAGPIVGQPEECYLGDPESWPLIHLPMVHLNPTHPLPGRCSILYTGDADFSSMETRSELRSFISMERWTKITVLQVPHHGSVYNWEIGSSPEFLHQWSVFCADPDYTHQHPDHEVMLDLIHHGPRLVDKQRAWSWNGEAYYS